MVISFDLGKSLQVLEGHDWGEPDYDSGLVQECHRLRRVPLREFTVENLRIMIGQNIGLEFLIPLALERLRDDPLAEGDCYPGDLLVNVLGAEATFWKEHADLLDVAREISERAISLLRSVPEAGTGTVREAVLGAHEDFKKRVG